MSAGDADIAVGGGGNAAIVAALTAADAGARVLVQERAPVHFRGGNSRHTRNIRCAHDTGDEYTTGPYPFAELRADLCGVGEVPSDERLAELTIRQSADAPAWMSAHGARWQPALTGTLNLARANRFFLGGGRALLNSYYRTAERAGVAIAYDTKVTHLEVDGEICTALHTDDGRRVRASSVICASGGFEADLAWLGRYWGEAAEGFHVRGPAYNDGGFFRELLDAEAQQAGEERGFHAVAVDAAARPRGLRDAHPAAAGDRGIRSAAAAPCGRGRGRVRARAVHRIRPRDLPDAVRPPRQPGALTWATPLRWWPITSEPPGAGSSSPTRAIRSSS
ncbi:FAD-binding protein [Streptomyces sp. NBC_01451]|uniref:FAD-binding protein n=1 Tax=Streptomyces sp. NBC_01451 TaxID=2903872 RepID=UPI002E322340|nr:FAD-binding protein [Streptomyces sp. NBC_01451]